MKRRFLGVAVSAFLALGLLASASSTFAGNKTSASDTISGAEPMCTPTPELIACEGECGGERVSNGCGGYYNCPKLSPQLCCAREEGRWIANPPPGHCELF